MTRTLVYGLGDSGIAATRALLDAGGDVLAADANDGAGLRAKLEGLGVDGALGATPEVLAGVDRVVASPGVPPGDPVLRAAEDRSVPVISEVGLGLELLGRDVRVAAVTGTNGKTTVVDMLLAALEGSGVPHTVAGNSWRPLTGCLDEARESGTLVLELSSFQLHYLQSDGFEVAALLNVRPDHLNWHSSYDEYVRDKLRVFDGQRPEDLALISAGDPVGLEALEALTAGTIVVGRGGTEVRDGALFARGEEIAATGDLPFTGAHNYENSLFAAGIALKLGASVEGVRAGLEGYELKSHRLEVVCESGGVLWVDDSKATNPAAVAAAIESFTRPIVLILGGSEKETDFSEVSPLLHRCRAVVCQGEAGPRLFRFIESEGCEARLVPDLDAAIEEAGLLAKSGDVVLLSPGCASFDQFDGYAARGEAFARLARGWKTRGTVGG